MLNQLGNYAATEADDQSLQSRPAGVWALTSPCGAFQLAPVTLIQTSSLIPTQQMSYLRLPQSWPRPRAVRQEAPGTNTVRQRRVGAHRAGWPLAEIMSYGSDHTPRYILKLLLLFSLPCLSVTVQCRSSWAWSSVSVPCGEQSSGHDLGMLCTYITTETLPSRLLAAMPKHPCALPGLVVASSSHSDCRLQDLNKQNREKWMETPRVPRPRSGGCFITVPGRPDTYLLRVISVL